MRGEHLLSKLSFIDHKWVKEAEIEKKNNHKLRRAMLSAVAVVAALAVAAGVAMGVFVNSKAFVLMEIARDYEHVLRLRYCIVDDHLAEYEVKKLTDRQQEKLADRKGELYLEGDGLRIYRFADREDLVYLIFEQNGELMLGEFYQFSYFATYEALKGALQDPQLALMYPFSQEQLERITVVPSPMDALRMIYGLENARDIRSVTFKKTDSDRTRRGESVKVKTVTLREHEDIDEFFDILCALEISADEDWSNEPGTEKIAERLALLTALEIPSVQVDRTILVELCSGYILEMRYDGELGKLRISYWQARSSLNDEMNDWFIEKAKIDFSYQGYAENPHVPMGETATVRPAPSDTADLPPESAP